MEETFSFSVVLERISDKSLYTTNKVICLYSYLAQELKIVCYYQGYNINFYLFFVVYTINFHGGEYFFWGRHISFVIYSDSLNGSLEAREFHYCAARNNKNSCPFVFFCFWMEKMSIKFIICTYSI